jgi:DNA-damage-inducible protein D
MTEKAPDFDTIRQTNVYGIEYWSARDLMPLLGYDKWQRFEEAVRRAKMACEQTENNVDDHFTGSGKMIVVGKGGVRNVKDYHLSRFACYLVAQNGDPRKPEIAAAQVYFAVATRQNEMHQLRKEQEERLAIRLKVSESYKALGKIAMQSGVNSETFGVFIDAGYLGLHHHTVEELRSMKGVPEGEDYLDNIGREELSAIDFKNVQTESKLKRDPVDTLNEASQAHYFIGSEVRKAIEAMHAPMPEDLPSAASIRKMVEERQRKAAQKRLQFREQEQAGHKQGSLFGAENDGDEK